MAFAPYIIIVVVLGVTSLHPVQSAFDKATSVFSWPGLHVLNAKGKAPTSETFKWTWLTAAGTWLFVSGVLTALVLRVRPVEALRCYWRTIVQIKWALLTVCTVLAIAYVMNLSGQTITLGTWAAGAGAFFAFLSPLIGWFGTAVTGSDGVLAKMISPQNLAIGAAAVGLGGREGDIFRRVVGWSVVLVLLMAVLVLLQSGLLSWMVP